MLKPALDLLVIQTSKAEARAFLIIAAFWSFESVRLWDEPGLLGLLVLWASTGPARAFLCPETSGPSGQLGPSDLDLLVIRTSKAPARAFLKVLAFWLFGPVRLKRGTIHYLGQISKLDIPNIIFREYFRERKQKGLGFFNAPFFRN